MTNIILKFLTFIFFFSILISCRNYKTNKTENYELISYLDIKVDNKGNLPQVPYVIDLQKNNKHLIVVGTLHSRDTTNDMFSEIEKIFNKLKPEIAINEGGQITKTFPNKNSAILKNGETGLLKFLCDKQNIKMLNGDMPDKKEFAELETYYSKDEILFFFASERFVLPYTYWNEKGDLDSLYESELIKGYLISEGIKLTSEENQFSYYKSLYKKYFKKEFNIDNINSDDFSPIRNTHHFCEIARKSKELRDKYLIQQIEKQLKYYDKVLVVFGGWHILAIEPALTQVINKIEE